jgi:hypothetical protein
MGCPKCGYGGHNKVYHWGTREIECDRCRHDYPVDNPRQKESRRIDASFKSPLLDSKKDVALLRDVGVWDKWGHTLIGTKPINGVHAGKISGLSGDDLVRDHNGYIKGRISGAGHLITRWW